MDDQTILVSDDNGRFTGEYIPKIVGHTGLGKRHLAITVLLINKKGEVLLQKRRHKVFDNLWDFTGSTHPLHLPDHDESFEEATARCLLVEYEITNVTVKNMGAFNYFAPYHTVQGELCENEHCAMMIGEYNGPVHLNSEVGYVCEWIDKGAFLQDTKSNPQKYCPWVLEGVEVLERAGFFK